MNTMTTDKIATQQTATADTLEIVSFNLDTLDVEELERRLEMSPVAMEAEWVGTVCGTFCSPVV